MKSFINNAITLYVTIALISFFASEPAWAQQSTGFPVDTNAIEPEVSQSSTDFNSSRGSGGDIVDFAVRAGSFDLLVAALTAADLVSTLKGPGPFTVFAPTDAAFAKLPPETLRALLDPANKELLSSILTFHVAPGAIPASSVVSLEIIRTVNGQALDVNARNGIVKVENAKVILPDNFVSNGIVHAIDTVMIPEPVDSGENDIIEYLQKRGDFSTLLTALRAGGLLGALKGDGPFTLFAPTNDAFDMIPDRLLNILLEPKNQSDLVDILTYHVVPGEYFAGDFTIPGFAPTLNGNRLFLDIIRGQVYVENARVIAVDVETSNGVIHVIDTVLIP